MDLIDPICTAISVIITLVEKIETTKANKERCQRIAQRIRLLEEMVLTIKQRGPDQISNIVCKSLNELWYSLISAKDLITIFSQTNNLKSFVLSKTHEEQFCKVNERLTENLQALSGALHIEQGHILFEVHKSLSRQTSVSSSALVPPPTPTSPTAPPTPFAQMPLPMPAAPMLFRMPYPMAPPPRPMPVYPPTVTTTVFRTPLPPSFRYAAAPGPCISSVHMSHPIHPMPFAQSVPPYLLVSPTLAPTSSMPVTRPVTIISVQQQNGPSVCSTVKKLFN